MATKDPSRGTTAQHAGREPDDLQRIAAGTLAHYEARADDFREGTRDHDVSQNIAALLQSIEAAPPFYLFDFGCGPGRGLETFKRLGHRATGIEGSSQLAAMARANCASKRMNSRT